MSFLLIEHTVLLHLEERVEREGMDLHVNFALPLPDANIVRQTKVPRAICEETAFETQGLELFVKEKMTNSQSRTEICL